MYNCVYYIKIMLKICFLNVINCTSNTLQFTCIQDLRYIQDKYKIRLPLSQNIYPYISYIPMQLRVWLCMASITTNRTWASEISRSPQMIDVINNPHYQQSKVHNISIRSRVPLLQHIANPCCLAGKGREWLFRAVLVTLYRLNEAYTCLTPKPSIILNVTLTPDKLWPPHKTWSFVLGFPFQI